MNISDIVTGKVKEFVGTDLRGADLWGAEIMLHYVNIHIQ